MHSDDVQEDKKGKDDNELLLVTFKSIKQEHRQTERKKEQAQ